MMTEMTSNFFGQFKDISVCGRKKSGYYGSSTKAKLPRGRTSVSRQYRPYCKMEAYLMKDIHISLLLMNNCNGTRPAFYSLHKPMLLSSEIFNRYLSASSSKNKVLRRSTTTNWVGFGNKQIIIIMTGLELVEDTTHVGSEWVTCRWV